MQAFNPDNPLGRRSGEGRNPAIKNTPRSGQNHDVVPLARGILNYLDTGLRRYDTVFSNGLFGFKHLANLISMLQGWIDFFFCQIAQMLRQHDLGFKFSQRAPRNT